MPTNCGVCGQRQWEKDTDPKTGRWIPDGTWPSGETKYRVHAHRCPGKMVGPGLDSVHERVDQAMSLVETKKHADHVNTAAFAAEMAIVKEDVQTCKQYLETLMKKSGLFETSDAMLKKNIPVTKQTPEEEKAEILAEIAGNDDLTAAPTTAPSINFVREEEILESEPE